MIAVLLDDTGNVQAIVEDFGNENARVRLLNDVEIPSGKTIQVWTLPSQDMGPVSMGLLEGAHSAQLKGPDLPLPRGEQLYELTLEPAGGSPTGRPTGPVLSKGYAKHRCKRNRIISNSFNHLQKNVMLTFDGYHAFIQTPFVAKA